MAALSCRKIQLFPQKRIPSAFTDAFLSIFVSSQRILVAADKLQLHCSIKWKVFLPYNWLSPAVSRQMILWQQIFGLRVFLESFGAV